MSLLIGAAALLYLIFIWRTSFEVGGQRFFTLIDDAMISMRYARNLAQGYGFVWNPGAPPVEGFTNPGWTLVMAAIHLLPLSAARISLAVMIVALAVLLANVVVVYQITQTMDAQVRIAPWIAAAMTGFYFPLVFWTLRGLEVGALSLAINVALLLTLRIAHARRRHTRSNSPDMKQKERPRRGALTDNMERHTPLLLGLVMGGALLIRLDALLQITLLLIYLAAAQRGASRGNRSAQERGWFAGLPAAIVLITLGAILAAQRLYFGDFLPNTYYLKINGVTAWERIRAGLLALNDYGARDFLMPFVMVLIALVAIEKLRSPESRLLLALFLAQVAYSVWVGGDYAEELVDAANRFVTQGMPALFILFAMVLERFLSNAGAVGLKPLIACAIGLGAIAVISGEPWGKWLVSNAPMLRTDIQRVRLGLHIQANTDPRAVVAVHAAGQIPYYSGRQTIDMLGKSDPVIAKGPPATGFAPGHNKWNYDYSILQLKPDVIADNFNRFSGFIGGVPEYERLPSGIWVRVDSSLVNKAGLASDY